MIRQYMCLESVTIPSQDGLPNVFPETPMGGPPTIIDRIESLSILFEGFATWAIQPVIFMGLENQEKSRFTLADALALSLQIGAIGLFTLGNPQFFPRVPPLAGFIVGSAIASLLWVYAVTKLSVRDIAGFLRRFAALTIVFPFWLTGGVLIVVSPFMLADDLNLFAAVVGIGIVELLIARCTANWIAAAPEDGGDVEFPPT
jgi:hypothetical protein